MYKQYDIEMFANEKEYQQYTIEDIGTQNELGKVYDALKSFYRHHNFYLRRVVDKYDGEVEYLIVSHGKVMGEITWGSYLDRNIYFSNYPIYGKRDVDRLVKILYYTDVA